MIRKHRGRQLNLKNQNKCCGVCGLDSEAQNPRPSLSESKRTVGSNQSPKDPRFCQVGFPTGDEHSSSVHYEDLRCPVHVIRAAEAAQGSAINQLFQLKNNVKASDFLGRGNLRPKS
jgi:hypothetical protein